MQAVSLHAVVLSQAEVACVLDAAVVTFAFLPHALHGRCCYQVVSSNLMRLRAHCVTVVCSCSMYVEDKIALAPACTKQKLS